MKRNYTQLSININKELKLDFKEKIQKEQDFSSIKQFLKEEIRQFIIDSEITMKETNYDKSNEELINVEILKNYKERLEVIINRGDNNFYNLKEVILYLIKKYIDKTKTIKNIGEKPQRKNYE